MLDFNEIKENKTKLLSYVVIGILAIGAVLFLVSL